MTFTSEDEQGACSPEKLKEKLKGKELSGIQRMMGDIITENENLESEACETHDAPKEEAPKSPPFVVTENVPVKSKKSRKYKGLAIAAGVVLVAIIGVASPVDDLIREAVADKSDARYQTEENDYGISGEGLGDSGGNVDTLAASIDDWERIGYMQEFLPQLLVPQYLPGGATFVSLDIAKWESNGKQYYNAEYSFEADDGTFISILQVGPGEGYSGKDIKMHPDSQMIKTTHGEIIYRYNQEKQNTVCVGIIGDKKISILGDFTEADAVEILKNMK